MSLPSPQRAWTISPCNRIPYVSLVNLMGNYLLGIKNFLKTAGLTVIGSCDGTTGAMDGVDRWSTAANAEVQATDGTGAQSWMVLLDGNGVHILLANQGGTADVARFAFSPGALYVAAGTPSHQPTATDEQVISSALSIVGSSTSADRLWSGWVSSDKKACRFAVARSGVWLANNWGVESVTSTVSGGATFAPPVWGFSMNQAISASVVAGVCRAVVASVAKNIQAYFGLETFASNYGLWGDTKVELQGGTGYPIFPLSIGSQTSGANGKIGNVIDQWLGRTSGGADGDTYGTLSFIAMTGYVSLGSGGGLWPWDGITTPVMT